MKELNKSVYENETFKAGGTIDFNACVGNNGFSDLYTYQCGYYEATVGLINNLKKSTTNIDLLIYPIVYSARHTIELFIKNQLFKLKYINSKAQGKKFESKIKETHDIKELWTTFKSLSSVDVRYRPHTNILQEYILDFCEVDNTGETFRYPFDHKGVRHLTDLWCINIEFFEKRFIKLYEAIKELDFLTDFLVSEYEEATVIKSLSRQQIKEIALELPIRKDWEKSVFTTKKNKILKKYNIGSNTFSKTLKLIQGHKEFSSYVGLEVPLKEINAGELRKFIVLYNKYRLSIKKGSYIKNMNVYASNVCKKITSDAIQSLSALFDIGFFNLYPEAYERIVKEKAERDVFYLVFGDTLDRGIVLETIKIALEALGQKTLLQAFD